MERGGTPLVHRPAGTPRAHGMPERTQSATGGPAPSMAAAHGTEGVAPHVPLTWRRALATIGAVALLFGAAMAPDVLRVCAAAVTAVVRTLTA